MTTLEACACAALGALIFGSIALAALADLRAMLDEGDRG
jgi:hypothetical protein